MRINAEPGEILHQAETCKTEQGPEERIPPEIDAFLKNAQQPPQQEQRRGAYLQDRLRPGLNCSVCEHGERHQSANADTNCAHGEGRTAPREIGTKETSSTQTVPRSLLSNFELGSRRKAILTRRVRGPAVKSASSSAQGCVPTRFGVSRLRSPSRRGSEMENRMPLSVESSSMCR